MVAKSIEVEMAGDGIDYAKSRFKPDLDLEGVYTYRDQTPKTSFFLEDSAYAGLKLTIPFYDGGERKAVLAEARSKLREAELARGDYRKAVELQVRRAYSKLKSTATVRESYREQVAFARENYDMVFKQYSLGVADNVAVIDAETTLVQAEMGLLGADFDRDLSAVMLMRATGTLLDEVEARSAGITVRYEVDKDESE
jgi:outer membrane protein TolC